MEYQHRNFNRHPETLNIVITHYPHEIKNKCDLAVTFRSSLAVQEIGLVTNHAESALVLPTLLRC